MTLTTDGDRLARAALTCVAEPGDAAMGTLLRTCAPAQIVAALTEGRTPSEAGRVAGLDRALRRWGARLGDAPTEITLDTWRRDGVRLLCPGDPGWPGQLEILGDAAPWGLWVRGSADLRYACLRSVSIVGTRAATSYGEHVCLEMSAALAERGWAVVSGGAFGIDRCAHQGALAAEGVTIAVLASGVDEPYPISHHGLFEAIAAHGVLVSGGRPGLGSWSATASSRHSAGGLSWSRQRCGAGL